MYSQIRRFFSFCDNSFLLLNVVFIICIFGITTCSDKSPLSQIQPTNKSAIHKQSPFVAMMSMRQAPPNNILDLNFVLTETGMHTPPPNADIDFTNADYHVSANIAMANGNKTIIHLSSSGKNSTPPDKTWDLGKSAARQMPTKVSYRGGNTLNYTIEGQQKTFTMNNKFTHVASYLQQNFENALQSYRNMPAIKGNTNPLLSKTDQEIKQMIESKGYSVNILGNNRFKITITMGGIKTTEIFNANTFTIESSQHNYVGASNYQAYYDNGMYMPKRVAK